MKTVIPSESIWVHPSPTESIRVQQSFYKVQPNPSESIWVHPSYMLYTIRDRRVQPSQERWKNWFHPSPSESIRVQLSPSEFSRVQPSFYRVQQTPFESIWVHSSYMLYTIRTEEFNRVKKDENTDSIRVHPCPSESIRVHLSPSKLYVIYY